MHVMECEHSSGFDNQHRDSAETPRTCQWIRHSGPPGARAAPSRVDMGCSGATLRRFGDDSGSKKWTSDIKERGDIKYLEARGLTAD